jgi:hypothetical protein
VIYKTEITRKTVLKKSFLQILPKLQVSSGGVEECENKRRCPQISTTSFNSSAAYLKEECVLTRWRKSLEVF